MKKVVLSLFCLIFIFGCSKDKKTSKSSAKQIIEFSINSQQAVVDEELKTITLTLTTGTNVEALSPTITLSDQAEVSPESGAVQNFAQPVAYTVTAEDGSTADYTVIVTAALSNEAKITAFAFSKLTPAITATIDQTAKTIKAIVPYGTSVTALVPAITVSGGAIVNPASGAAKNFTDPVQYVVTAKDGTTKATYTATVSIAAQTQGWKLVWQDEFNGTGLPDDTKWNFEKGYVRNDELQYYASKRTENAVQRDGKLVITARNDNASLDGKIREITSASITTKESWLYGRVEVRAKIPSCLGSWPAIWMMPKGNKYGSWPKSGEIDIMEHVGYDPNKVHFNLHSEKYNHTKGTQRSSSYQYTGPHNDYHIYAIEWFADHIDWYFDNTKTFTVNNDNAGWESWPFDQPFYLILNFAFGGSWGGLKGVDKTALPQEYLIDYVRIYQWQ